MSIVNNSIVQDDLNVASSYSVSIIVGIVIILTLYYLCSPDCFIYSKRLRKTIMKHGHLWSESIPSNPKSCHECGKLLLPGQDRICECDYCGSYIHDKCISKSKFRCKQLISTKPVIKHLWLDGNIDIGTTCCICREEITSFVNLSGKRCVWCQRVVHDECLPQLNKYCDFGHHNKYIISPSFVRPFYSVPVSLLKDIADEDSDDLPLVNTGTSPAIFSSSPHPQDIPTPTIPLIRCSSGQMASSTLRHRSTFSPLSSIEDTMSVVHTDNRLQQRLSADSGDDDISVYGSPPPNLTEYKSHSKSEDISEGISSEGGRIRDETKTKKRRFSFQSIFGDVSKGTASIMNYVRKIKKNPEVIRYLERDKTADHRSWTFCIPEERCPVLVFINSKSGGLFGSKLLPQFRRILHPVQVVDLQEKNPREALANYVTVDNLRILVCGGDVGGSEYDII